MDLSEKNKKYWTFVVFRPGWAAKPLTFYVPYFLIKYFLLLGLVSLSVFLFSLVYSAFLSSKMAHYNFIINSETEKDKKMDLYLSETNKIKQEIQTVLDQNNQLREALGLKVVKTKLNFDVQAGRQNKQELNFHKNNKIPLDKFNLKLNKVFSTIKSSGEEINKAKLSLKELKERVEFIKKRMASVPSTWPIHGSIVSRFGYRVYPWRGRHTGLDIQAPYGAAVKAAASGRVSYSGIRQGYGLTVQVDHGYGFSTLYGHNSKLLVLIGDKIKKGQIISLVGTTGYSTGPHLHYEVRKYDVPVNPIAFLDVNILSAGRYF